MRKTPGFTLIELIIVISLLAILAVFALPRFSNFVPQATNAARNQAKVVLNSAIGIAHAQWFANGLTGSVQLDGAPSPIIMNAAGYPDIGGIYNGPAACTTVIFNLLSNVSSTGSLSVNYIAPNCIILNPAWASSITLSSTAAN